MNLSGRVDSRQYSSHQRQCISRLCITVVTIFAGFLSTSAQAEIPAGFVAADSSCTEFMSLRSQWKTLSPELADPPKIPLFERSQSTALEWKRLYLPKRELTSEELRDSAWRDSLLADHGLHDSEEPGLLVNSQPWIDFLRSCPEKILSNRTLSSGRPDWVAPDFFELYTLPLAQQQRQIVSVRFTDRSPRFGGEYVALYLADYCPAEKIFVSQGENQQLQFLKRGGQLVLALRMLQQGLVRYLTFVPQTVDNSYFVEICRTTMVGD